MIRPPPDDINLVIRWTSLIGSTWLLDRGIIPSIGIIGIYLSKIHSKTTQRPLPL